MMPEIFQIIHLDIRNQSVFIYFVGIEHGAVGKILLPIHQEFTEHTELIITPKEND